MLFRRRTFIILVMGIASACATNDRVFLTATPSPCLSVEIEEAIGEMEAVALNFDEALEVARRTARNELPPILNDMTDIRQEALGLRLPQCATAAHTALVDYIEAETDAYRMLLGNRALTDFVGRFLAASELRELYGEEIETLAEKLRE